MISTKVTIIGLGNLLLRDEGIGVQVITELKRKYDFPEQVRLLDGGTLGLDLLPLIEGQEQIIFIDAISGHQEPGTVIVIEDENLPSFIGPKLSFHHVGLSDLLFASSLQGSKPAKVVLMGIQPEKIEVGLSLSDNLRGKMPQIIDTIVKKLETWGIKAKEKNFQEPSLVLSNSF